MEPFRADTFSEDPLCNCGASFRRNPNSGWTCAECGRQTSITGRTSFRQPEPFYLYDLKPIARRYIEAEDAHTLDYSVIDDIEAAFLRDYTQADVNTILGYWNAYGPFDVPGYDDGGDEVS